MSGQVHRHLSQLSIERYLLGEMDSDEERRVRGSLELCDECRNIVESTRADNEAFAMQPIPKSIRALEGKPPRSTWLNGFFLAAPVAAAAAVALVLFMPFGPDVETENLGDIPLVGNRATVDTVRLKGSEDGSIKGNEALIDFGFYVLKGDNNVVGRPGQRLTRGDRIQFWYDSSESEPAVVVGIDGRGVVTRYAPVDIGTPLNLEKGRGKVIKSSVLLDDSTGLERFFLCAGDVASSAPEDVEKAAREIAESGVSLKDVTRLPIQCRQASVWIDKE